ncbi:MAG TPA: APC family permease [Planctomycetota bacterium]|jgi:amino acid transporter|nr:APC family permease [Planctomycetota bacterium]
MANPAVPEEEKLDRRLGPLDAIALAIGGVIGTGIYFLPGEAAFLLGPASLVALLIAGGLAMILALCYAEAGSRFSGTGGAMRYSQVAFGSWMAFTVGWATWVARVVSWAGLSNAFVMSLGPFYPQAMDSRGWLIAGLVVFLTAFNLRGVAAGGRANGILLLLKLVPLLMFVGLGIPHVNFENFTPFAPEGMAPLGQTTVLLLFAFVGFEGMAIPAGEMKNPRHDIPRGLIVGVASVLLIYVATWMVCLGTLPGLAGQKNPVAEAAAQFMGSTGSQVVLLGIVASVLGINAFMALTTPRALYALGLEAHLPPILARTDRRGVPAIAILATSGLVLLLALTGTFAELAVLSVVARLAQYIPTALAVLKLRGMPGAPPAAFRVPLGPLLPLLAVGTCLWLAAETPRASIEVGGLVILSGLVLHGLWRLASARAAHHP